METLQVSCLAPDFAASLLAGLERMDPAGMTRAGGVTEMAHAGQCFAATTDGGQAVYVIKVQNGVAWVSACKGSGRVKWQTVLLPVIEAQAKGCAAVAFQTSRPGLVRAAKAQGYEITGWILKKKLQ